MKPLTIKKSRFKLKKLLDDLHGFTGEGNPLPAISGDIVYHDYVDLAEALASDLDEDFGEIPNDSLKRLEAGLPLFGYFALFNGDNGFDCIDGQEVEVPCLDEEDEFEEDEPRLPRRRRTKKYLEMVENTICDECTSYGYVISLDGDTVEIEAMCMRDVTGDCELEMMLEPHLLGDAMLQWVKSFCIRKTEGKS